MSCATKEQPLRTVLLGGRLGRQYGKRHRLAIASPAEAIRALSANFPDFRATLTDSDARGVGYRVLVGQDDLPSLDALHEPSGGMTITLSPVVRGGKSALFQIFEGIALVGASFLIPGGWAFAGVALNSLVAGVGFAMVLGGVAQLISPQRKSSNSSEVSYGFNGAVNTIKPGLPVPFGYGECYIGGALISAGTTADQVPTTQTGVTGLTAVVQLVPDGAGGNSYELYASWTAAGLAVAYDVTVQGSGFGPYTAPRTTATSEYVTVPGTGPYEVICNPVEGNIDTGSHGAGATVQSVFLGEGAG